MKIYLKGNEIIATQKTLNAFLLEECQQDQVQDKVAYWKFYCFYDPQIQRAYEDSFKFKWKNKKTGTIVISQSPVLSNVKLKINDYVQFS